MQFFNSRFTKVLHAGAHLARKQDQFNAIALNDDSSPIVISLGLLEETELIVDVLSQVFEHANLWQERDPITFANMKDYILFSVPKLLALCDTQQLKAMSYVENQLSTVTTASIEKNRFGERLVVGSSESTGLSVKAEACLIKIFLACSYSTLSCLLFTKDSASFKRKRDLIQTWFINQSNQIQPSMVLSQHALMQCQTSDLIRFAFESVLCAQERMQERLNDLKNSGKVFEHATMMMHTDSWIQQEYS